MFTMLVVDAVVVKDVDEVVVEYVVVEVDVDATVVLLVVPRGFSVDSFVVLWVVLLSSVVVASDASDCLWRALKRLSLVNCPG